MTKSVCMPIELKPKRDQREAIVFLRTPTTFGKEKGRERKRTKAKARDIHSCFLLQARFCRHNCFYSCISFSEKHSGYPHMYVRASFHRRSGSDPSRTINQGRWLFLVWFPEGSVTLAGTDALPPPIPPSCPLICSHPSLCWSAIYCNKLTPLTVFPALG